MSVFLFTIVLLIQAVQAAPAVTSAATPITIEREPVSLSLARQKVSMRQWKEAGLTLDQMVKNGADPVGMAELYASVLLHLGRRVEAVQLLRKAAQRNPARAGYYNEKAKVTARIFVTALGSQAYQDGVALAVRAKLDAALEQFKKAESAEPENGEVVLRLGQIYLIQGELPQAVEMLELARELMPGEPQVTLWLGRTVFLKGDRMRSGVELKSAFEKLKQSERAVLWYSDWLHQNGQKLEALKILEQHQKAHPLHLEAILASVRIRFMAPVPVPTPESQEAQESGEAAKSKTEAAAATSPKQSKELWELRKLLQLASSRFDEAMSKPVVRTEASRESLDLIIRAPDQVRETIDALLKQVDEELEGLKS